MPCLHVYLNVNLFTGLSIFMMFLHIGIHFLLKYKEIEQSFYVEQRII